MIFFLWLGLVLPVSSQLASCPVGLYLSNGECLACPANAFCAGGVEPYVLCSVCGGGVNYFSKACSLARDTVCLSCSQCAAGFYVARACNATADTVCLPCPSGSVYCLGGVQPAAACSPCVVGNGVSLIKACTSKTDTVCFTCPPGYLCTRPPIMSLCPAGYACTAGGYVACDGPGDFCPAGSSAVGVCPAGFYCVDSTEKLPCAAGFYCPARTYDFSMFPCTRGSVCVQGSSTPAPCVLGNYCPDATTQAPCPSKYYCPAGVADYRPYPCALGSFCGGGASAELPCPAGYYCSDAGTKVLCPVGFACVARSVSPIACSQGSSCLAGTSAETDCPGGYFCLTPSTPPALCPAGYICPVRSQTVGMTCPEGTRCPAGSVVPQLCPPGFVCTGGKMEVCAPGEICPQGTGRPVQCGTDGSTVCKTNTSLLCPAGSVDVRRGVGYVMFNSFNQASSQFDLQTLYAISLTDGSAVGYTLSRGLYADGMRRCINPVYCRYGSPLLVTYDRSGLVAFTRQQTFGGVWVSHMWAVDLLSSGKTVRLMSALTTSAGAEIDVQAAMFWGNGSQLLVAGYAGVWMVGAGVSPRLVNADGSTFGTTMNMFQTDNPELAVAATWAQIMLVNVTSGVATVRYGFGQVVGSMDIASDRQTLYIWVKPTIYRLNAFSGPLVPIVSLSRDSFYGNVLLRFVDSGALHLLSRHVYEGPVHLDVLDATTGARTGPYTVGASIPWSYTFSISGSVASDCRRCVDVPNGAWSEPDNCRRFQCNAGYWQNASVRCVACSQNLTCNRGQYLQPCAIAADAFCARCPLVQNMANWTDTLCNFTCANGFYRSGYACVQCNNATCRNGMFREQCDGGRWVRDAKCVSCVPPGRVGTYRWTGGGCAGFNCSAGWGRIERKCVRINN